MATYDFIVYDAVTGVKVDRLPFTSFSWTKRLNQSSQWSGAIPLDIPRGLDTEVLAPGRGKVCVFRDGVYLFGGLVWGATANLDSGTYNLTGADVFSQYERLHLTSTRSWTDTEQLTIAAGLVAEGAALGGLPLGVTNSGNSGVRRDRTYRGYEHHSVGKLIAELAACELGFDWSIAHTGSELNPEDRIHFGWPYIGRDYDIVLSKANCWGINWTLDGKNLARKVFGVGAGSGREMVRATATTSTPSAVPLHAVVAHKDVSRADTLAEHARADLKRLDHPTEVLSAQVRPDGPVGIGAFDVGDIHRVSLDSGPFSLGGYWRIMEYKVDISSDVEQLSLTSAPKADTII